MGNYLFSELDDPLHAAVARLCERDEATLPYVFVEEVVQKNAEIPKAFVQWCTKEGVLLFDVPWAKIVGEPMTITGSVQRAKELLRGVGVCEDDRVMIYEDCQRPRPKGDRIGVIFPEDFVVKKPA